MRSYSLYQALNIWKGQVLIIYVDDMVVTRDDLEEIKWLNKYHVAEIEDRKSVV